MTLVYEHTETPRNEAKVHLLCIGVGRYTYLAGGDEPRGHAPNLGQLTSPPVSAVHFATWIKNLRPGGNRPVGSIELVLSPAQGVDLGSGLHEVGRADRDTIQSAFDAWLARCNLNERNIAMFYFAGHGLDRGGQILLASDFGHSKNGLWSKAINWQKTFLGMKQCRARTQLFLLDACREWPEDQLNDLDPSPGEGLCRPAPGGSPATSLVISATVQGRQAFGAEGDMSNFMKLLMLGFKGMVADRRNGQWVVPTDQFASLLDQLYRSESPDVDARLGIDGGGGEVDILHVLDGPPTIPVRIQCDPPGRTPEAALSIAQGGAVLHESPRTPNRRVWTLPLLAGVYDIIATFPDNPPGTKALRGEFLRPADRSPRIPVD